MESLMRDVARAVQGDARRRQLLPDVQARLERLDEQSRQSQRAHGTWRLSLLGAAACAAGVAIFVMRPTPLSFALSDGIDGAGAGRTGAVGERLVAADSAPLSLRFSDGSQVTLPPRARAQVDTLDANGATVALEEGIVDVSVVHRAQTRWEIRAGRYHIRVTGTKFSAGWDRRSDTLTVTMREGSVEVTGPGLKAPARVVGGQRLRANEVTADVPGEDPEVVVEDATTAAREAEVPAPSVEAEPPAAALVAEPAQPEAIEKTAVTSARDVERRGVRARRAVVAPAPTRLALADAEWRGLEAKGKLKEAFAAALREGDWNESCRQLGAADLVTLGNMARVAGHAEHAEMAYRAALRRNPAADRAVYGLGRLAFDQRKNYAAAESYFSEYVKRFPTGALVGEAAGLLLESRIKAGHNAGARDAAAHYLSRFPNGPHAKLARDTVGH